MQKRPRIRVTGPGWSEYPEALDFERARLYHKDIREHIRALELMENARKIWEEIGLPKLKPRSPWYGYNLGFWNAEYDQEADLALRGEHYQTGKNWPARERNYDRPGAGGKSW
jgi:hypothetical protein